MDSRNTDPQGVRSGMKDRHHRTTRQRVGERLALAAAITIVIATLYPTGPVPTTQGLCIFCGDRGLADFFLNVCLFAPLGIALRMARMSFGRTVAAALMLTLAIEGLQRVLPGRDAGLGDVIANAGGGALGWWVLNAMARRGPAGRGRASLPAAAAALALFAGLAFLEPRPTDATYFTQWTADFGDMERYEGRVIRSRVGPIALDGPPWRIQESARVRESLRREDTIAIEVEAGVPPSDLAPIFSIYDDTQREVVLLGARGNDVVLRRRRLAAAVRLDQPVTVFENALAGVRAGDTYSLRVTEDGDQSCVSVAAPDRQRRVCRHDFTIGDTWQLFYALEPASAQRRLAGIAWPFAVAAMLAVIGYARVPLIAIAGAVLFLWISPLVIGESPTPPLQLLAVGAGLMMSRSYLRPEPHEP